MILANIRELQCAGIKRGRDGSRTLLHKGTDRAGDEHDAATAPGQVSRRRPKSQAAPEGKTQRMTAAAPEGHGARKGLLAQGLVPQQLLLQGKECPTTEAERRMDQDLPTTRAGDQRFQLAWAR